MKARRLKKFLKSWEEDTRIFFDKENMDLVFHVKKDKNILLHIHKYCHICKGVCLCEGEQT